MLLRGSAVIVSHEHKFIFLSTRKTAGTSIELALRQLCGPDDIITPLLEDGEATDTAGRAAQNWVVHSWWQSSRPFRKRAWFRKKAQDYGFYCHIPAKRAKALLNDNRIWRGYFKFAFDRNPWDRQVSAYHFRYRRTNNPPSFSRYMQRRHRPWVNNYEIYSIDGDVCVDFVGRYESLEQELRRALSQIGIAFEQELPRAKGNFRPNGRNYREYYDDEEPELIRKWYAPEIDLLDYEF